MLKLDGVEKSALLDVNKVNNGVWITLYQPSVDEETGQRLPMVQKGTSRPQRALVRSYRCQAIRDAEASRQKDGFTKVRRAKKSERDNVIAESSVLPEEHRFGFLLAALENFSSEGGIQEVSGPSVLKTLVDAGLDDVVQQVREAAYEDDNYLATADTDAGNGSASTTTKAAPTSPPSPETLDA